MIAKECDNSPRTTPRAAKATTTVIEMRSRPCSVPGLRYHRFSASTTITRSVALPSPASIRAIRSRRMPSARARRRRCPGALDPEIDGLVAEVVGLPRRAGGHRDDQWHLRTQPQVRARPALWREHPDLATLAVHRHVHEDVERDRHPVAGDAPGLQRHRQVALATRAPLLLAVELLEHLLRARRQGEVVAPAGVLQQREHRPAAVGIQHVARGQEQPRGVVDRAPRRQVLGHVRTVERHQVADLLTLRVDDHQLVARLQHHRPGRARRYADHLAAHAPLLARKGQRQPASTARPLYCRASEASPWSDRLGLIEPCNAMSRARVAFCILAKRPSSRSRLNWRCELNTSAGAVNRRARRELPGCRPMMKNGCPARLMLKRELAGSRSTSGAHRVPRGTSRSCRRCSWVHSCRSKAGSSIEHGPRNRATSECTSAPPSSQAPRRRANAASASSSGSSLDTSPSGASSTARRPPRASASLEPTQGKWSEAMKLRNSDSRVPVRGGLRDRGHEAATGVSNAHADCIQTPAGGSAKWMQCTLWVEARTSSGGVAKMV